MKLAILSRNGRLYSTQRLMQEARARGHTVRVLDPLRCYLRVTHGASDIHYKGKSVIRYNAVIPRIGASVTKYGTDVLRQFQYCGVRVINKAESILKARDKLQTHQILTHHGLPMPLTVFGDNPDDTSDLLSMLGDGPCIIKLNQSSQGAGVIYTSKPNAARSVIETLRGLHANFLVQKFIPEANGCDIRCFVVGGELVACMRRRAKDGEFRSNLHRGATAEVFHPDEVVKQLAIFSTSLLGLDVAGVDILMSERGPLILEVNASPGLEGIEKTTQVNVAGKILDFIAKTEM